MIHNDQITNANHNTITKLMENREFSMWESKHGMEINELSHDPITNKPLSV